jgi:hypothetical protein
MQATRPNENRWQGKEDIDGLCIEDQTPGRKKRMVDILNRDCGRGGL